MIPSFVLGNITYDLFDAGMANILGLETLRHGTNLTNNLSIRIRGGNPDHGGKASGSTAGWNDDDQTKHYFFVFKDDEFQIHSINGSILKRLISIIYLIKGIGSRCLARLHTCLSGYNSLAQVGENLNEKNPLKSIINIFSYASAMATTILSPTIRFRFSHIDETRFEDDPSYNRLAYRTRNAIEPWRIGMLGSLITGINADWFSRVKAKPLKVLTGVAQLTCAVGITALCIHSLIAAPILVIPAVAGALLA